MDGMQNTLTASTGSNANNKNSIIDCHASKDCIIQHIVHLNIADCEERVHDTGKCLKVCLVGWEIFGNFLIEAFQELVEICSHKKLLNIMLQNSGM